MELSRAVQRVAMLYPRIFFACHTTHVRDPETRAELSAHQVAILEHLDNVEAVSLTGLAQHMGVSPSTMSLAIERLVQRGYVHRRRDAADGRRALLRLTPAGVRIKEAQTVLDPGKLRRMLAHLAAPQRDAAIAGLALLADAARREMQRRSRRRSWQRRTQHREPLR
jgi:DNA-binding MarR family transcriptional regulator